MENSPEVLGSSRTVSSKNASSQLSPPHCIPSPQKTSQLNQGFLMGKSWGGQDLGDGA